MQKGFESVGMSLFAAAPLIKGGGVITLLASRHSQYQEVAICLDSLRFQIDTASEAAIESSLQILHLLAEFAELILERRDFAVDSFHRS